MSSKKSQMQKLLLELAADTSPGKIKARRREFLLMLDL